MTDSPFFILGNRRSGTTMFRLMLTSHPDLVVPPEGGFIVRLGWLFGRLGTLSGSDIEAFVRRYAGEPTACDWKLDLHALRRRLFRLERATYPKVVDEVYREYVATQGGGRRWGDKTTWYYQYLNDIHSYYPNARYLHLIRDGRAVLASYRDVPHLPNSAARVAAEWQTCVRGIRRFGQLRGERYYEVHYEDLIRDPEGTLQKVCGFLGEKYSETMLEFGERNRNAQLEPVRHLGWKTLTLEKVTRDRIDRWKQELTGRDLATFWAIAGGAMETFGYGRVDVDLSVAESINLWWHRRKFEWKSDISRRLRPVRFRSRRRHIGVRNSESAQEVNRMHPT